MVKKKIEALAEWFKTEIWWEITSTVYWFKVKLSKPELYIRHREVDIFIAFSGNGKWVYYEDYITGETYKAIRENV